MIATTLPPIEPKIDQLEERQTIAERDAQAVYGVGEVADVEVREYVRILKVLHHRDRHNVGPPIDIRISTTWPHPDKT